MARGSAGMIRTRGGVGASDYSAGGGGGGGAPVDAQYWVGAANGTLTAERNLGALATGLVKNTGGVPSIAVAGTDYLAPSAIAIGSTQVAIGTGTGIAGSAALTFASGVMSTNATQLRMEQTGDTLGTSYLALRNRSGAAGAIIGNAALDVVDLGIEPSTTAQLRTIRLENRAASDFSGGIPEFQFGSSGNPAFCVSDFRVLVRGKTVAGGYTLFTISGAAFTSATASTEFSDVFVNLGRTASWATGNITTQRAFRIAAPTYAFNGASTITNAATFAVSGAPAAGTNATITNAYSIWSQSGRSRFDVAVSGSQEVVTIANNIDSGAGPHEAQIGFRTENSSWSELIGTLAFGWSISEGSPSSRYWEIELPTTGAKLGYYQGTGAFQPSSDGVTALGTSSSRFGEVYATKGDFEGNGTHVFKLPVDNTANSTGTVGRIPIDIGGTTRYLRYYAD